MIDSWPGRRRATTSLLASRATRPIFSIRVHDEQGRLLHTWRGGRASLPAYLDDHAALAGALITLYEATFETQYLDAASQLADVMLEKFQDQQNGGFFFTASDHEQLIARHKDWQDSSVPSGGALAALALLRLARLTGRESYEAAAIATLRATASMMRESPLAAGQMLLAADFHWGPALELVVCGDPASPETQRVLRAVRQTYLPRKVLAFCDPAAPLEPDALLAPLFEGKTSAATSSGEPALYVCERFACQAPALGERAALQALEELSQLREAAE